MTTEDSSVPTSTLQCGDKRLPQKYLDAFNRHLGEGFYPLSMLGGAFGALVQPCKRESLISDLGLIANEYGQARVLLTTHQDCAKVAAEGFRFASEGDELEQHMLWHIELYREVGSLIGVSGKLNLTVQHGFLRLDGTLLVADMTSKTWQEA